MSCFDPDGPAVVPKNAAAIRAPLPILWINAGKDRLAKPSSYAFDKAPAHPKSKYISIYSGHLDAPTDSRDHVLTWIADLER
ncbi:MAG TPA: hypothetical protein VF790_12790 [Dissulfurispiraceae bacterium]